MALGFVPNNIKFRIVSSQAIATFKNDQAVDFHEIVTNSDGTPTTREAMLLEYDRIFSLILRFERRCLLHGEMNSMRELIEFVTKQTENELIDIVDVMKTYPEHFDRRMCSVIESLHGDVVEALKRQVEVGEWEKEVPIVVFPKFVQFLSNHLLFLQHLLFCIESVISNDSADLVLTNWVCDHVEPTLRVMLGASACKKVSDEFGVVVVPVPPNPTSDSASS